MIARGTPPRGVRRKIRYGVVGLGYIAQGAVLPAFAHARRNSELAAIVSDDPVKLRTLAAKYRVPNACTYDEFDALLAKNVIDAVYIALPNDLHREYTERAARAHVHVLCEKPMAVTEEDCLAMMEGCDANRVKLMVAYRLHFEKANLTAIELVRTGELGAPRLFNSTFSMQVEEGNIRLQKERGGGPLYDIGIYCINAARSLFDAEPVQVTAFAEKNGEPRFREVPEMVGAVLRFSEARLATFVCSFGAADASDYEIVGTKGRLRVESAYEYTTAIKHRLATNGTSSVRAFPKRDQFAPELLYFSDCILNDRDPEPSGREGLADVRVIRALNRAIERGEPVSLEPFERTHRPSMDQEIERPPVRKPGLVHARSPHPEGNGGKES